MEGYTPTFCVPALKMYSSREYCSQPIENYNGVTWEVSKTYDSEDQIWYSDRWDRLPPSVA